MLLWSAPDCHVPEYSAKSPHILIFEITPWCKSVYLNCHHIFAWLHIFCYIKLGSIPAVYAISDLFTIHPEKKSRINSVKSQKNPAPIPICRNIKITSVASNRITFFICSEVFWRHCHNIWEILLKDISQVSVIWCPITNNLPVRRNRNFFPRCNIETRFVKINGTHLRPGNPVEFPHPIQAPAKNRRMSFSNKCFINWSIRHKCWMISFLV